MAVSMSAGMISMRSGYLATKLMAMADAFRSQSAWSCRKAGKSDKTVRTHSGRVEAARSSEYFMRSQVGCSSRLYQQWFEWKVASTAGNARRAPVDECERAKARITRCSH